MFAGNSSRAPSQSNLSSDHQRLSRISLRDQGPQTAAPRHVQSNDSLASDASAASIPPPFLTVFGELQRNRDSLISLTELEHGWSSHPSGLKSKQRAQLGRAQSAEEPTALKYNASQPAKPLYRPAFAPSVTEADLEGILPSVHHQPSTSPGKGLSRGKSLREKITGVIGGRLNQSTSAVQPEPIHEEDRDDDKKDSKDAFVLIGEAQTSPKASSPARDGFATGIARRLSRKTTRTRKAEEPGYTLPSQAELDNIPLYAAPAEAQVPNAPMLSSYAPRPALRPRAMTADGSILAGQANLKAVPSITVGQARLAYAKSVSRQHRNARQDFTNPAINLQNSASTSTVSSNASTINNGGSGIHRTRPRAVSADSNQEVEHLQMAANGSRRSGRRSRFVPEGWVAADAFAEVSSSEERDSNSPKPSAVPLPAIKVSR